jgi:hypothetical protein
MEVNKKVKNQEASTQIGFNHIYGHPPIGILVQKYGANSDIVHYL